MKPFALLAVAVITACAPGRWFHHGPTPNAAVEGEFARAVALLVPDSSQSAVDSAVTYLDAYLAYSGYVRRRDEAIAMRNLAAQAQRLAKVEAALREARASAGGKASEQGATRADDEAVKEIQRLKEELARANAELERIRKRLATPKP